MGSCVSCIVDRLIVKGAKRVQGAIVPFLGALSLLAVIETTVLLWFGIKYGCVKPKEQGPEQGADPPTEAEQELAAIKKESNRRLLWAVLCLLVSTLGSMFIGVLILGTGYDQWDGVYAAKAQLPILIGAFLLRFTLSIMIVGALLFGQFTGRDGSLCCCTCMLAPLAVILPLGAFVGGLASRDIESQPADAPVEKEGLLEAPLQKENMLSSK